MAHTASVTAQRLTSEGTTFTIADSAKAKASGDYGNYLTSRGAFTFGQSENKKANTVKRARRNIASPIALLRAQAHHIRENRLTTHYK